VGNKDISVIFQLKFLEAIDDCTRALELYPTYLKILILRAVIYEHLGQHTAALADYQRAYNKDKCAIATAMVLIFVIYI
jgi:tetratricopeptide (TPR) repeat protein